MRSFARLLEQLQTAPRADIRQTLLVDYFARVSRRDRGWAVALLSGSVSLKKLSPAQLRPLIAERVDPLLLDLSQSHVGDLTDSVALLWPVQPGANREPELAALVEELQRLGKSAVISALPAWLDALEASGRWTLLKLVSGDLNTTVSPRLLRQALALWGGTSLAEIEEIWHSQSPPYDALMGWLEGESPAPEIEEACAFRAMAKANPLTDDHVAALALEDHQVEWKWNGQRVQLLANGQAPARLFTSEGEDISALFPDVLTGLAFDAVLDGELLVANAPPAKANAWEASSGELLDKRLNRKRLDKKLVTKAPAFVRVFDLLFDSGEDLRTFPLQERRVRLAHCLNHHAPSHLDLSPVLPAASKEDLLTLRHQSCGGGRDGLVIKNTQQAYVADAGVRPWLSWQPAPKSIKAVLLYVERPAGRSGSAIGSCTFGVWRKGVEDLELVPLGKAAFSLPKEEGVALERWVKENQQEKFGPVRSVTASLVLQVSYEALVTATRRKAGVTLKAPVLHAVCWGEDASAAAKLEELV